MAKQKAKSKEVMVVNNQPKVRFFGGIQLKPGVNSVPRAIAEQMAKHPHTKGLVSINLMEVTDEPVTTVGKDLDEAKALVAKTNDPELLDEIEAEDDRGAVKRAVKDQHEKIGPTDKKED
jgi:hypothetical protein